MAVTMAAQTASFFVAILFGVLCGVLYDGVRILRVLLGVRYGGAVSARLLSLRFPHLPPDFAARGPGRAGKRAQGVLIFVSDLLYMIVVGALFCVLVYWQNDGIFRSYLLAGAVLGYTAYYVSVGRLVLASAESVAFALRLLFAYLFLLVRTPLLFLFRWLRRAAGWAGRGLAFLFLLVYRPFFARRAAALRLRRAGHAFLLPGEER